MLLPDVSPSSGEEDFTRDGEYIFQKDEKSGESENGFWMVSTQCQSCLELHDIKQEVDEDKLRLPVTDDWQIGWTLASILFCNRQTFSFSLNMCVVKLSFCKFYSGCCPVAVSQQFSHYHLTSKNIFLCIISQFTIQHIHSWFR